MASRFFLEAHRHRFPPEADQRLSCFPPSAMADQLQPRLPPDADSAPVTLFSGEIIYKRH